MKTKRFVLAAIVVITGIFGYLVFKQATNNTEIVAQEVKGLSSDAIYVPNNYINLGVPQDFVIVPDGNLWYTDRQNFRIVKISPAGAILRTVGKQGANFGEFEEEVEGITADQNGNLYVLSRCKIHKFDSYGGFLKSWGGCGVGAGEYGLAAGIHYDQLNNVIYVTDNTHDDITKYDPDGTFIATFAASGSGNGQLDHPVGVVTDANGKVYVVDGNNQRVQRFSSTGVYEMKFGTFGAGDGEFTYPKDIAIASNGLLYVSSQNSQRIQVFNSSGVWQSAWGENGTNAWQFLAPQYLGFDASGNLYVSDYFLKSIQKFTASGVYVSSIRNSGYVGGRFYMPSDVAYDSTGNLYVLDNGPSEAKIQKFTNAGTYLSTIVSSPNIGTASYHMTLKNNKIYVSHVGGVKVFDTSGTELLSFGTGGTGNGEFTEARGIDVDAAGNIYVADMFNSRIQKFDSAGTYLLQWGTAGTGNNQFGWPSDLYIDSSDNIYVADTPGNSVVDNSRVQVFDTSGTYIRTIGTWGYNDNELDSISGMIVTSDNKLHITDGARHKIKVYSLTGTFERAYGENGSSVEQFTNPGRMAINPITDTITVADTENHRVQMIPGGTRILNLTSSADVLKSTGDVSLVKDYINPVDVGASNIASQMMFGDYVVADFNVNMTADRNWSTVAVTSLINQSTALVVNLNPTDAPGVSASHSVYIVKQPGQTSVRVCPDAVQVTDITLTCINGYTLQEGDATLSSVTINSVDYWKVTGLTGTGIMSEMVTPTPTPTITPTVTTSTTVTPTVTATATPTVTVTATPTVSTTVKPTVTPLVVTTLAPVAINTAIPACPTFEKFSASETIVEKGKKVTFNWETKHTESVKGSTSDELLPAVGVLGVSLSETADVTFVADNGYCTAKKTTTIHVVDTLPWTTTVTVGTGLLLVEAVVALQQPALFGNIWLALAGSISRRKRQTWGVVYDSTTKKPLSRAVIRLMRSDKTVVDTVVSDATGSFKLTPKIGEYYIEVKLAGYSFPSTAILAENDGGYSNVYKGTVVKIEDIEKGILLSIPLDKATLSDKEKKSVQVKNLVTNVFEYGSTALLVAGFIYGAYIAVIYPHVYNYLVLGVYALLLIGKLVLQLPKNTAGKVLLQDGSPAMSVEFGLFDPEFNTLVYRTFSNEVGQYSFVVPNKTYLLKVMDTKYKLLDNGVAVDSITVKPVPNKEMVRVIKQALYVQMV